MASAWLILPTYNEAENLEPMVRAVLPRLAEGGSGPTILVVDDASPDGTGQIADRLAAEIARGAGAAPDRARTGSAAPTWPGSRRRFEGGADLILQMDCDFSHDPADVPRLIAAASTADVVLGSRYVPGGGVENWALRRRIQSRGGCAYARLILGVPVRDLTGGFKCWRRAALEALDFEGVDAHGYGFQIEMTYRAIKAGLSVDRGADRVSRAP